MAGLADNKSLPPLLDHERRPCGRACCAVAETCEFPDLVHCHLGRVPTHLTPSPQEPNSQLLPWIGEWTRLVVGQSRPLVPHQGYPAEPSDQWPLAVPFDPGFEALTWSKWRFDLGPVSGRHLRHRGLVLCCQGLEHRRLQRRNVIG